MWNDLHSHHARSVAERRECLHASHALLANPRRRSKKIHKEKKQCAYSYFFIFIILVLFLFKEECPWLLHIATKYGPMWRKTNCVQPLEQSLWLHSNFFYTVGRTAGTNWSGYHARRYTEHALTDTSDVSFPSYYTLELKITRDDKTEQWVRVGERNPWHSSLIHFSSVGIL
jgi:hypothetical protein